MAIENYSVARNILRFEGKSRRAYWKRFSMLLGLSVVIATMGLVRDSGAVVIAAMLIAPLMTPILGIAASMVVGRSRRVVGLFAAVVAAALACVGLAFVIVYLADVPKAVLPPVEVLARTNPGTEDLIVALAAGTAGAYVQINRSEISLLPGAAIGVSLVPPLCAAGVLLYFGDFEDAYEAGLLFSTNLAAIVCAACAVYIYYGGQSVLLSKGKRRFNFTINFVATMGILAFIVAQLVSSTYNRYSESRAEAELARVIKDWSDPVSVEIARIEVSRVRKRADVWVIVDLPFDAQNRIAPVSDLLPEELKGEGLVDGFRKVLGTEYAVAFRYQTRFAGLVFLGTEFVLDAPSVEETSED